MAEASTHDRFVISDIAIVVVVVVASVVVPIAVNVAIAIVIVVAVNVSFQNGLELRWACWVEGPVATFECALDNSAA